MSEPIEKTSNYVKRILIILLTVTAVGSFAYGAYEYARAINLFALEKIVVSGTSLIENENVLEYTDLTFGTSLFDLPLDSIQQDITQNPFVLTAQASRQFPRTLFLEIQERQPIAYINHGEFRCVDKFGFVMPLPPAGLTLEIPILSGFTSEDTIRTHEFSSNPTVTHMVDVLTKIQDEYPELYPEISELIADSDHQYTLYTAENATRVYLGNTQVPYKLRLLETFWHTLEGKRSWADYEYIDLRYKKQIIVRERT